jgi:cell division protein FtsI (penicillin-binding protein 3)
MTTLVARPNSRHNANAIRSMAALSFWRLLVLVGLFSLFALLIIGRLAMLAFFESSRAFGATTTEYVPERGDILDRNGTPLARTIQGYAVWVKPDQILGDKQKLAQDLAVIFPDEKAEDFYAKLTAKRGGYLRKRAMPEQVRRVHDLGEIAIEFPREDERLYPQHELAAHVLGFVDQNGSGVIGMERVLNQRLRDPKRRAKPIELSLDVRIQAALEIELASGMKSTGAKGAAGVILDVKTGEVMAMSTLPSFNPNRPNFSNTSNFNDAIAAGLTPISYQTNSVTNRVYELGSTFKPLTVAAALDAGTVRNLAIRYNATAPLDIAGFKIRDTHPAGRWLNVPEALVHSSNVVTAQIADNLGKERLEAMLRRMEFDRRPSIELAERSQTLWPKSWGRVTTMTVGYGHGMSVTPLHLASAYAAMVNGGIWRPATLMKQDAKLKHPGRRVFTAATSARMRQLLRMIWAIASAARQALRKSPVLEVMHGILWCPPSRRLSQWIIRAISSLPCLMNPKEQLHQDSSAPQGGPLRLSCVARSRGSGRNWGLFPMPTATSMSLNSCLYYGRPKGVTDAIGSVDRRACGRCRGCPRHRLCD